MLAHVTLKVCWSTSTLKADVAQEATKPSSRNHDHNENENNVWWL